MVLFGAPESMEPATGALRGVQMALAMQNRLGELNEEWLGRGHPYPFKARMGVNTGISTVGSFGSDIILDGRKWIDGGGGAVAIAQGVNHPVGALFHLGYDLSNGLKRFKDSLGLLLVGYVESRVFQKLQYLIHQVQPLT